MVVMMKNEGKNGDDGNWMNEEDKSAFDALMENNCFHVDVQEQGHHERNGEVEENEQLMQKKWVALNKKWEEGMVVKILHFQSCSKTTL